MKKLGMDELVKSYIESKKNSWSEATQSSEGYRLRGITREHLTNPEGLWNYLKNERKLKPYALKTTFIRVGELAEFAYPKRENAIKQWMQDNARKFKNVYNRKQLAITFDEAMKRIISLEDKEVRQKALELLATGMRISESRTLDTDNNVATKGGGTRRVPNAQAYKAEFSKSDATLRYHLKKVGLTPHMLRKLCATKARELGADLPDLMSRFGWRSVQTAIIYLQAEKESLLNDKMAEAIEAAKKGKDGK